MKVQISIKSLIKESYALFKENILILLGLIFGGIVFSLLLSIPSTFQIGGTTGILASSFLRLIFQIFFTGMIIKYCLHAIKGYDPGFKEILPTVSQCLKYIGFSLVTFVLGIPYFIIIGFSMFKTGSLLPSSVAIIVVLLLYSLFLVYLMCFKLWLIPYLIFDKNYGIFKSIKESWIITSGNTLSMFKLILITFLLFIAGIIALLIGVFVAMGFSALLCALYYTKIASQLNDGEEVVSNEE